MGEYDESRPCPPPSSTPALDQEWAEYVAWVDREMAADSDPEPEPEFWTPAEDERPAGGERPAEAGPEGPRSMNVEPEPWGPRRPRFGQGQEADACPPGPLLVGLTEQAIGDLGLLSDDELVSVLQATRRQMVREQYKQVLLTAEFGRRRQAAFEDATRRGVPAGCRPGGFPGEELAMELVTTRTEAGHRIDDAIDLTTRLPLTLAGMAAGQIDEARAGWVAFYTRGLTPADAARADEILADAAPDLTVEQVARKGAALEMKFAPDAVKARRERAKRNGQRVEARRELSGNASLSGREMDTADAMASKAYLDAIALKLRSGGLAGTLGTLRVLALADLTQGRDPLARLGPPGGPGESSSPVTPTDAASSPAAAGPTGPSQGSPPRENRPSPGSTPHETGAGPCPPPRGSTDDNAPDPGEPDDPAGVDPARLGRPGPLPALINLTVPAATLLGWSATPAQAGAWGILDRGETRTIVAAASRHPGSRWCVTLTAPDGTALAHACARGQHPTLLDDLEPQPPPGRLAELLHRLGLTFTPIARGSCDHTRAEDRYTPSRKLMHMVRARTAVCDAPACHSLAAVCDLDHTTPWPDGPSDECNLAPRCRTHHRAKQAPDWRVEQPAPGVTRWTLPSGRVHTTSPTGYDA